MRVTSLWNFTFVPVLSIMQQRSYRFDVYNLLQQSSLDKKHFPLLIPVVSANVHKTMCTYSCCILELTALTHTPSVEENILHVRNFVQPVSYRSGRQEVCQSMTSFAKFVACLKIADSLLRKDTRSSH